MTWREFRIARYWAWRGPVAAGLIAVAVATWACEVSPTALVTGLDKGLTLVWFFLPPDWSGLPELVVQACVTLALALVATPIGAVVSLAVGVAAARNVAPRWLRSPVRLAIAVERGVPELITSLLLVAAFGLGPFAGVVALSIASIGMLGKLVADAVEEVDASTVDAVTCVGATPAQVLRFAVLPLVLPSLVSNALFRLEVNIRSSVLLGAIGGGGIGYELNVALSQLEYEKASAAAIVTLALIVLVERATEVLRRRVAPAGAVS